MKFFSSKRNWVIAAVVLLALFVLRPGGSRLKSRVIASISSALGRSVDIGSVHLRLLPQPGFDLANLVVYDDPAFGAEPMLRAGDVMAALRLTSLVRGRMEISRLELTEPSLNLVRGEGGRWNLEALLERTAQMPLAPTAKAKSEPRPGFPYIEASSARINFKSGPEKKPYALTNADFSLWQDSENTWGVRLKAQPVRSDLSLNDMGILRVDGTWQRAAALRDTPLQFSVQWDRAQAGQITKFFTGNDQGWRGGMLLEVKLSGTPAKLGISNDVSIQDFRRYDITSGEALRLAAHCDAQYSSIDRMFRDVMCSAPVGSGSITLKGELGVPGSHRYGIAVIAEKVPATAAAALVERIKKNLPEDLLANGSIHGSVTVDEAPKSPLQVRGEGEISDFHLSSAAGKTELAARAVPFAFTSGEEGNERKTRRGGTAMRFPAGPHFEIGPFPVAIGRTPAPVARGWMNRSGYVIAIAGDAEVGKALKVSRMLGLPVLNATAEGTAQIDLKIAGAWPGWGDGTHADFPAPQVTGTVKLKNVRVSVRGTDGPVEIASADMQLGSDEVRVEKIKASAAGATWTGSVHMPRGCGVPGACEVRFDLGADRIALGELAGWASPRPREQPWYRVLDTSAAPAPSSLPSLRASGRLTADRLEVHTMTVNHVSAAVSLDRGKVDISELNADVLGGKHRGAWQADFAAKPSICTGSGNFSGIVLGQLADRMKDAGLVGTGKAKYQVRGPCSSEFWTTAEGTLQFDVHDAVLPRLSLAEDEGLLAVRRVSGEAWLRGGKIEFRDTQLDSSNGKFNVSGTASFAQELDLKLARGTVSSAGFSIRGTLTEPRVAALPGTEQARLKPVAAN